MKHSSSQGLFKSAAHLASGFKLLSLAFVMILFMGTDVFAQRTAPPTCVSSPVPTVKPYIGYNGLTNNTAALYSWCQNETPANIQTYCDDLASDIVAAQANYGTMTDGCKAELAARKQELGVIQKVVNQRLH